MSDEIIIQHLRDKESQLLNELNKVRVALKAFIDDNITFNDPERDSTWDSIPHEYEASLTYGSKILYLLATEKRPMLADEITDAIHVLEPTLDLVKLRKSIGYNLSMLAKYSKVKKHPFSRKVKYSLP